MILREVQESPNFGKWKGGNLNCTSRVICVCWYQISRFFNFGGHFYYSNFSSWSNESALRFFDFALFHGQNQVLSLFVTFRHFFNNNLDCTSRVICACWYQILSFESWKWPPVATFKSLSNKSALRFLDFALFHVFFQVLTQIVTFLTMVVMVLVVVCSTMAYINSICLSWNLAKIRLYNFLQFSWPRVHETLKKSDASM